VSAIDQTPSSLCGRPLWTITKGVEEDFGEFVLKKQDFQGSVLMQQKG